MRRHEGIEMSASERRKAFRRLLAGSSCVTPAAVFNPISARIADELGFEVGLLAGSIASLDVLGGPDIALITLSELAEQARRICRASKLALLVDADHGYGNALNVIRTVQELESAGVAALTIEDTRLPTAFGSQGPDELISVEEAVGKMRAACGAREDPSLAIVGRTNLSAATASAGFIDRAKAYEAAGVDALFIVGLKSREQLEGVAAAIRLPLILGSAPPEVSDLDYLAGQRVRVRHVGHYPYQASVKATYAALTAIRKGEAPEPSSAASPEMMKRLMRDDLYAAWAKDFLRRG
jgi:carboxyvinyl-carboxyphosphonate phosphorylmutase